MKPKHINYSIVAQELVILAGGRMRRQSSSRVRYSSVFFERFFDMCKRFLSCISLLTLVAMFLVACSQTVQADKILRYKFKQGDKLSYEMKQTMDIKMNVVGQIIYFCVARMMLMDVFLVVPSVFAQMMIIKKKKKYDLINCIL